MKLDIKKQTSNTIITQAYHSRCSSWKLSSKARIAWDFWTLLRIKQGEKRKRCHPKSDFRLWQATHLSTKKPINKLAMNNRRLLIAAVFHCWHSGMSKSCLFCDKIGYAKSVVFLFYLAIWRSESQISYLEITFISLICSLTYSRKKEFLFWFS